MIETQNRSFAELVGFPPSSWQDRSDVETHGTTVLAIRYNEGVLMLADRRATAGNLIMYERAEKVVPLDDSTLIAISGSFAKSVEITRYLRHSFKYYRRVVTAEMSLEGKLMEISRALANNMGAAMQGIGIFLPIVAAYDRHSERFGIYFFDPAGARFENDSYACAGSGSERIRGVFEFLGRTQGMFQDRPLDQVLENGLQMLDIAAELDSATGGFMKVLPAAMTVTRQGVESLGTETLSRAAHKVLRPGSWTVIEDEPPAPGKDG